MSNLSPPNSTFSAAVDLQTPSPRSISRPPPAYINNTRNHSYAERDRQPCLRIFSAPSFNRNGTTELENGRPHSESSTSTSRSVSEEPKAPLDIWNSVFPAHRLEDILDLSLPHPYAGQDRIGQRPRSVDDLQSMNFNPSEISVIKDSINPNRARKLGQEAKLPSPKEAENFILLLTRALMRFGAPSHRIESQLTAVSIVLGIDLKVHLFPKCTLLGIGRREGYTKVQSVKAAEQVELGRLQELHSLYRRVVHRQQSAKEASKELKVLLKKPPIYSMPTQAAFSIICGMILCPMAFKGSVFDLLASGLVCGAVALLQSLRRSNNTMVSQFLDTASFIFVAFVARGFSSIPSGIFCYSAILSSAIVKLFPKYQVICGSLELASKQIATGSVKLVYAVIQCLFLAFSVSIGSDLYYIVDHNALNRRLNATEYLTSASNLKGIFIADGSTVAIDFTFTNLTMPANNPLYSANGCYRDPIWSWYLRAPPQWTLAFLVPLFSLFSALASFQPVRSRELPVTVFISSCSYAANRVVHGVISYRADACSAMGAFVVGVLGHLYSRIFHGTAFISMYNGIGFLVPGIIAATGGLSQNYRGKDGDHYTTSLQLAMQMIQVAGGTTVGLYLSAWVVYSFGAKKKGALWAF